MSTKKVQDVDSIYSGGSTKRNRIFDDISCSSNVTSAHWASIFSCCWRRNRETKPTLKEYNPNEWDYIVEKLVIKRVPISLFATEEDFQEFIEDKNYKESSYGPQIGKEMKDKQVYSAMSGMSSSSYFLKSKARGDLSNKPSSKNLRFNRDEDLLDEDAAQAGPSNYNRYISDSRVKEDEVENEYLNQFSSLHPDLKESERPPKDPNPLNPPRSKRSLAENISEIASTKRNHSAKSKKGKVINKQHSNVYITVSNTSREISTVLDEEDVPTRDKNIAKQTSSVHRKVGSTSCLPFTQKLAKSRAIELAEGRRIRQGMDLSHNQRKLSENSSDRNSNIKFLNKESQFRVHYVSPEHNSIDKVAKLDPCELDAGFQSQRINDRELSKPAEDESATEAASYTSDDIKNANSAGTTLRWKIIIKHHQPTASQTASESATNSPGSSKLPTLNDDFNRSRLMHMNTDSFHKIIGMENTIDYKNG